MYAIHKYPMCCRDDRNYKIKVTLKYNDKNKGLKNTLILILLMPASVVCVGKKLYKKIIDSLHGRGYRI